MPKQQESKLDRYADILAAMEVEKKTLVEMLAWLKEEGVTCSISTLSRFLESARSTRLQEKLLTQIALGAQQCKAVDKQFGKDPSPDLETLVKLHRVLILQLSTQGNADPEFLKLADQLMRTAMEYASGQTRFAQKERELKVAEDKLELLKAKAAQAEATKEVLGDAQLTAEQREQRIKEIYGRA
jgi:hypothetical protein